MKIFRGWFAWYHWSMTNVDVFYRYAQQPHESALSALGALREVYGVRKLSLDAAAMTVRVEYDATRFTRPLVLHMLRRAGLDIVEEISLLAPQAVGEDAVPAT